MMNLKKLLLTLVVGILSLSSVAQTQELRQQLSLLATQLPLDTAVRKGVLPNGLTYYIRHNAWPEKRAYFYIAQNVGSMQEDDNQRGLAHFLEHMCFNGTKHFSGNQLKTYLESIGVKFGENLNAYTSFDEIVYNIDNVKTESEGSLDSCLLILHDWSCDLLLEDEEIDKERGVINEEWRMRRTATQRLYEAILPEIYPGSKYADRMPIGTMEVVMNFPYQDLRDYYHRWFRTDLQAIVVVGDFDVDRMEQKIKDLFTPIPAVQNPEKREFYPVPDNAQPLVSIQTDKEMTRSWIGVMLKHDVFPKESKNTPLYYIQSYMTNAISTMFGSRIDEILQKENPPFLSASLGDGEFFVAKTKDALSGNVSFKDNGQDEALTALYREMLRVARHGFTASEYERYRQDYLSSLDNLYQQKDKTYSNRYVNECVRNYLDGEPMPGIEVEYPMMKQIAEQINVDAINGIFDEFPETDSNLVIVMMAPDKPDIVLPTKEELLNILHQVRAENIEPYKEEVNNDPLITETLKGSKVKSIKDDAYDAKLITLKNGIKIHVKKTDFTPNSITLRAVSWGGTSLYSNDELPSSNSADAVGIGGWGNFTAIELQKRLAGIQASVSPTIGTREESITGNCVKKDFETMLQLTYLAFTAPHRDDAAFNSLIQRQKESIKNADLQPTTALRDSISKTVYNDNVRARRTREADIDKISYDRMLEIYKERFANAADFEFFLIGDLDIDSVTPLLAKYIGSLPVSKQREQYKDVDVRVADGELKNIFEKEQQTPNAITLFIWHAHMQDNQRNALTLSMLQQLLTMLYTESVREDEGGAYGVPVQEVLEDYPESIGEIAVQLPTAPEKRERMTAIIYQGTEDMCTNGPSAENLQKVKEYMHRSHQESLKQNGYWLSRMQMLAREGKEYVSHYDELVDSISADDIRQMANDIFHSGNRIEVGMTSPVATE